MLDSLIELAGVGGWTGEWKKSKQLTFKETNRRSFLGLESSPAKTSNFFSSVKQ